MLKQKTKFLETIFFHITMWFQKRCQYTTERTQECLLAMLEKFKRSIDKGKYFGALTDLLKARQLKALLKIIIIIVSTMNYFSQS